MTRTDHDVPTMNVSRQRDDFPVEIRMPSSQPPQQQLPTTTISRPLNRDVGGRLSEPPSSLNDVQSSSHVRAEEFLQVSISYRSLTNTFFVIVDKCFIITTFSML